MRRRRAILVFIVGSALLIVIGGAVAPIIERGIGGGSGVSNNQNKEELNNQGIPDGYYTGILAELERLEVKGRAPKTGYTRAQFGNGWLKVQGCSTRDIILNRDLKNVVLNDKCQVVSGTLHDPYTAEVINFTREQSSSVQIDHIVALSDAWQKGAQQLSLEERVQLANDPLELWSVSGESNQQKSDGDAATWLPKNKDFRCEYVARQVEIKKKYRLWVTSSEKEAITSVLTKC